MAKVVTGKEAGVDAARVRISSSRARRGKILAVEHPIFGWLPYRQWALLRLIPEDRIVPALVGGVSTFYLLKVVMDATGKVAEMVTDPFPNLFDLIPVGGGPLRAFFKILLGPFIGGIGSAQPIAVEGQFSDLWKKTPIPFYGALAVSAMILAGVDPGDLIIAISNLIPSL